MIKIGLSNDKTYTTFFVNTDQILLHYLVQSMFLVTELCLSLFCLRTLGRHLWLVDWLKDNSTALVFGVVAVLTHMFPGDEGCFGKLQ